MHASRTFLGASRRIARFLGGLGLILASYRTARAEPSHAPPQLVRVKVSQFQMGMMVHLTVWAGSTEEGQTACAAAFQRVRDINRVMSDYEPDSELSRLCRRAGQGPVAVSRDLGGILAHARRLAELSGGQFDPTAGPVVRLWRAARKSGDLPDPGQLEAARAKVDYRCLILDEQRGTVELTMPGMQLDLGGVAKGYAGDEALAVLRRHGISRAAFEAGGDKVLGDAPPGVDGWLVEFPQPGLPPRRLVRCAVSVSGDTVQFLDVDGKRYSHVIDPRTGRGLSNRRMCVVVAPRGAVADPLSTLGTIMEFDAFDKFVKRHFPTARFQVWQAAGEDAPEPASVPRIPAP
jgi:thiamine biosynthesis lipoprotein